LSNLSATQERERKGIEEQIAEEAHHLNDSNASYKNLTDDLQRSVIVIKNAAGVTVSAQATIAKAQALIQDNEKKLVNEKKKVEEL